MLSDLPALLATRESVIDAHVACASAFLPLALFEDPESAGRLERLAGLAWWEPGDLVDGLGEKWSARIQSWRKHSSSSFDQ